MDAKPYVSASVSEMEREFREARKVLLARQEAEIDGLRRRTTIQFKDDEERKKAGAEELKEELEELKVLGIDENKLKEVDKQDEKRAEEYVAKVEPKLIAGLPDPDDVHRQRVARAEHYNRTGLIAPACLGADLLTSDEELLSQLQAAGKSANPGIWFNDPNDVRKIKLSTKGTWRTSACGGSGVTWGKYTSVVWSYIWTPQADPSRPGQQVWNWIVATVDLLGFYYLYARDRWWNCKHAWVDIKARIELLQGFFHWGDSKKVQVLFEKVRRGTEAEVISEHVGWDEWALLQPNQPACLFIIVTLGVDGKGSGSRAKLDFTAANGGLDPALLIGL
ncbi:MAG: hypothetical protein V3T41_04030 [bacterium]